MPALVKRVMGAFVVGPWSVDDDSGVHTDWLWVSDDGKEQVKYSIAIAGPTMGYSPGTFLFAMSKSPQLTWVAGSVDGYAGGFIAEDAPDYTLTDMLLKTRYNEGRSSALAGISLDGERGLIVPGPYTGAFATFARDGSLVGAAQVAESLGTCWRHVPTEHGNAFLQDIHLWEFSASGEILVDYDPGRSRKDTCPVVALTDDGIAILAYEEDSSWHLHRVGHNGSASEELWEARPGIPLALASLGDVALVVSHLDDGTLVRVKDGEAEMFPLPEVPSARAIPAEPGKLFLDLSDPKGAVREIVEIGCAD
ncbi:hypothetical protein WME79_15390 [Sorangium sp. So ce726]|uniref:hypothetical protein n=1 Tax=Sorangium sp. So ce726 TaxID=3133319 RepID=UPI003F60460B